MRWILLLLVLLNAFYYVWHQQQAPLRVKEVAPAGHYQGERENIHLLSEGRRESTTEGVDKVVDVSAVAAVCLFLGSFEDREQAKGIEQRLLSLDIEAQVRSVDAAAGVEYWVYLSPLASRQASLRQLRELQARRIDSYIFSQGELANGISLGIFPSNDSADSVMKRLRGVGYAPEMREISRAYRRFWVRVSPQSRRLADEFLLGSLAGDFVGLQHQLMPCEGVALHR